MILVSGGSNQDTLSLTSVELLYTNGSRLCSLPDLPYTSHYHSQTGLTACGGWDSPAGTTCHTLSTTGSWEQTHSLSMWRRDHSAWASPQGTVLLGGRNSSARQTSEILLENGDTTPGFNLDYWTR